MTRPTRFRVETHYQQFRKDRKTMSIPAMARKYNCHKDTMRKTLSAWGITGNMNERKLSYEDELLAIELCKTMTLKQVADKFDCHRDLISRALLEHGIDDIAEYVASEHGMDYITYRAFCDQSETLNRSTILTKTGRPCYVVIPYDEWVKQESR